MVVARRVRCTESAKAPVLTLVLVMALVLIVSLLLFPQTLRAQESEPVIKLRAGIIVPGEMQVSSAFADALTISGYAPGEDGYYIVQFVGPVEQAWKDQIVDAGGQLLDYLPDYAFKVRMTPQEADQVGDLDAVNWVGIFQPLYKLNPAIDFATGKMYTVRIEDGSDVSMVIDEIEQAGIDILDSSSPILTVLAEEEQITALAQVLDVAWIDAFVFNEKHNEYGAGVIVGANTAHGYGYDGSTQTSAVADTGIGGGTAASAHADIPDSRVTAIIDYQLSSNICMQVVNDGPIDVDSGHGTHVATSVLGDGSATGLGKGTAPAANLVFQAIEDYIDFRSIPLCNPVPPDGYYLTGLPGDLTVLFQHAYDFGARVHANSWGSSVSGEYTTDSANADAFIWNNPDMTITFSAGNEGVDNDEDGEVDDDSTGSPATAKNVLTIGASENDRSGDYSCDTGLGYTSNDDYQPGETCLSMGGNNILGTAGERWDFLAEPLMSDVSAGNSEQMAPFSSRGPTDDGRIKPDVVATGTWILSGFSDLYQEGYDGSTNPQIGEYQYDGWGMPFDGQYKYMGGTSMSNPIAAGAAVVVRDFYSKTASHNASAALVKATLINSAIDLLDENNDGANDNDFPIPNIHEGWGRINLAKAVNGEQEYLDVTAGLTTGISNTHTFDVKSGGSPFKVTLVWSDTPSTEAAAQNLVNDLDLIVTSPDVVAAVQRSTGAIEAGTSYLGNDFSDGWSQSGGSADNTNNVENVFVQSAGAGTWTVQVSGTNVPSGPQPYALVVDGAFDAPLAVTLSWFQAEWVGDVVEFSWRMATERGTAGFHVLAETPDGNVRLTDELIPSQAIDSLTPIDYRFSATTGAARFYLQEVGIDGSMIVHGPFAIGGFEDEPDQGETSNRVWLPTVIQEQ